MVDKKISELTNITGANMANNDEFVVVDTSEDVTKAITFVEVREAFYTWAGLSSTAFGVDALSMNSGINNSAFGVRALQSNTTGVNNTSVGHDSLQSNTTGLNNSAFGLGALQSNTEGSNNTAIGYQSIRSNTTGNSNTALGLQALLSNTTGTNNTSLGVGSLSSNTEGSNNTAIGYQSIRSNTTGGSNAAVGLQALFSNTTGTSNTSVGRTSLSGNTTGVDNCAFGISSLISNTTGSYNMALGSRALESTTTGSGNIGLGFRTSSGAYAPVFDPTTEDNRLVMGHTSVTNAYVKVAWTVTSDARDKTSFAPMPYGLSFVEALEPTEYQFKRGGRDGEGDGIRRLGFLAQDVLALEGGDPILVDDEDQDNLKLKESALIPVMVKAIQELSAEVRNLKSLMEKK